MPLCTTLVLTSLFQHIFPEEGLFLFYDAYIIGVRRGGGFTPALPPPATERRHFVTSYSPAARSRSSKDMSGPPVSSTSARHCIIVNFRLLPYVWQIICMESFPHLFMALTLTLTNIDACVLRHRNG